MTIGIIGTGAIGGAIAKRISKKGFGATIANSRGPDSLKDLIAQLGDKFKAATVADAAKCDLVLVAVSWPKLKEALAVVKDWSGRIAVDMNNAIDPKTFAPLPREKPTSSEDFATYVPCARVIKAFNTLNPVTIENDPEPPGKRVVFFAGDDAAAKKSFVDLLKQLDFFGVDLGGLADGGRHMQFPGGELAGTNLVSLP